MFEITRFMRSMRLIEARKRRVVKRLTGKHESSAGLYRYHFTHAHLILQFTFVAFVAGALGLYALIVMKTTILSGIVGTIGFIAVLFIAAYFLVHKSVRFAQRKVLKKYDALRREKIDFSAMKHHFEDIRSILDGNPLMVSVEYPDDYVFTVEEIESFIKYMNRYVDLFKYTHKNRI